MEVVPEPLRSARTFAMELAAALGRAGDADRICHLLALVATQSAARQGQLAAGLRAGDARGSEISGGGVVGASTASASTNIASWGDLLTNATCSALLYAVEEDAPPSTVVSAVCGWLHGWSPQSADPPSIQTSTYALRYVPALICLQFSLNRAHRAHRMEDAVALASVDTCLLPIAARENHRRVHICGNASRTATAAAGSEQGLSLRAMPPSASCPYYIDAANDTGAGISSLRAREAGIGGVLRKRGTSDTSCGDVCMLATALAYFVDQIACMPAISQLHFCDMCVVMCELQPLLPPELGVAGNCDVGGVADGIAEDGGNNFTTGCGSRSSTESAGKVSCNFTRLTVLSKVSLECWASGPHALDTATVLEMVRGVTFCASRAAAGDAVRKTAQAIAWALHAFALEQVDARVLLATTACCAMLPVGTGKQ